MRRLLTVSMASLVLSGCHLMPSATNSSETVRVDLALLSLAGEPNPIGHVFLQDSRYGLVLKPVLKDLPAGLHGFHVHSNGSCDTASKDGKDVLGLAAGGHYDPKHTNKHDTPWGNGHLGDLPALTVTHDGTASQPVLAPRLRISDVLGRSLMVHAGGDNHADHPAPLGGGGARIACGVIPASLN